MNVGRDDCADSWSGEGRKYVSSSEFSAGELYDLRLKRDLCTERDALSLWEESAGKSDAEAFKSRAKLANQSSF